MLAVSSWSLRMWLPPKQIDQHCWTSLICGVIVIGSGCRLIHCYLEPALADHLLDIISSNFMNADIQRAEHAAMG